MKRALIGIGLVLVIVAGGALFLAERRMLVPLTPHRHTIGLPVTR
jgi:hypothetical protein